MDAICTVDRCGRKNLARGYCNKHYRRWRRYGDVAITNRPEIAAYSQHGLAHLPEHRSWVSMLSRCNNPNSHAYHLYGGRGIKVCERWRQFENFYADMGKRPSSKHSIDREDVDGNYKPSNCRWATPRQQTLNQHLLTRSNTSGFRGVSYRRRENNWVAHIKSWNRGFIIGTFDDPEYAASIRDQWAIELHGDLAKLNFEYVEVV